MVRVMSVSNYRRNAPPLPWKMVNRRLKRRVFPATIRMLRFSNVPQSDLDETRAIRIQDFLRDITNIATMVSIGHGNRRINRRDIEVAMKFFPQCRR